MMTLKEVNETAQRVFNGEDTPLYFELPNGELVEVCNITRGVYGELVLRGETRL